MTSTATVGLILTLRHSLLCAAFIHQHVLCGLYSSPCINRSSRGHPRQVQIQSVHATTTTEKSQYYYSLDEQYHYDLTILIPAYNERNRIGSALAEYVSCLEQTRVYQHPASVIRDIGIGDTNYNASTGNVSILVIDDGSTDGTAEFVREITYLHASQEKCESTHCWNVNYNIQCISLEQNQGKGAAIERGMAELPSQCRSIHRNTETNIRSLVLVADADGSGDISCLNNMIHQMELLLPSSHSGEDCSNTPTEAIIVGFRECADKSMLRSILSWGFRTAVSSIFLGVNLGVRDTQCGFKLMTVSGGTVLYNSLNLRRWSHDVEVLHRAQLMGIPVAECKVPWTDKEGSKLVTSMSSAVSASVTMLTEIAFMRLQYMLGNWRVPAI